MLATGCSGVARWLRIALALTLASWASLAHADESTLTIGISQFPSTLHPTIDSMLAKTYVLGFVRRPIVIHDHDWRSACLLCVELPSFENGLAKREKTPNGDDGIAVTFSIHADAVWSDGQPITTADVAFTWEVGKHAESGVAGQEIYRRILSIDRVSDKTFTLHIDRVTFDYVNMGALSLLPAHLERQVFEADPKSYRNRTLFDRAPATLGLHHGPYRVTEVVRGSRIVLQRNPRWWGKSPEFDQIVIKTIGNTAALEANLLAGDVDYIAGELGLPIDQALALEQRHASRFDFVYKPGLIYEHIDFNLDNPVLADQRVRRALVHGIDRKAISEKLFAGRQPVADSSVNPLDWVHNPDTPHYAFEPKTAGALLDAAGWKLASDGTRRKAGKQLVLEIMTTAGNRSRELVQQVLQSQWKQLGIRLNIRNEPARVFFGETVAKRRFGAMAMYAWLSSPENVPRSTLHSEEIPSKENSWRGQNSPGYVNAEVDQLIDSIERELDPDRRKKLWARLQTIYAEELPAMPLFFRANAFVLPKWLAGIRPTGHQYSTSLWSEQWHRKP